MKATCAKIAGTDECYQHPSAPIQNGLLMKGLVMASSHSTVSRNKRQFDGAEFGRLTAIGEPFTQIVNGRRRRYVNCRCSCGTVKAIRADGLVCGSVIGCGCAHHDAVTTHGLYGKRVYKIWEGMLDRCHNPFTDKFKDYGGRGIYVTSRWLVLENFFSDMGHPPDGHSLERKDNDGPYCKSNCIWATPSTQAKNRRSTRKIEINGRTQCLRDWCKEYGRDFGTVRQRIERGWTVEESLSIDPSMHNRKLHLSSSDRTLDLLAKVSREAESR